ncbi:MAG: LysR family transcriptional regulator [Alphaproteobacteria bacterium]|jgi:DNA-binding transcriptional LysR family regulator|nr:LysR family transcriptional regulator [Alphaproteobacteria bacterium]
MDMLTSMRVFTHIAGQRSFRGAAETLDMTPSAISKHLAALEEHLGTQLIERTTRRVALTEVGAAYLARCRHIISEIDEAELEVSDATGEIQGILKVSAPPAFAHRHIAPHLPLLMQQYPRLAIDLITADHSLGPNDNVTDLHISITGMAGNPELENVVLASNTKRLVASPAYLASHGTPASVDDLSSHRLITLEYGHPHNEWHFSTDGSGPDRFRANGPLRMDSGEAVLRAILNGGGIAMLPTYVTGKHIHAGQLIPILDDLVREDEPVHAVWRKKNHRRNRIELLVSFLKSVYGTVPYWNQPDGTSEAAQRAAL